LKEAFSSAYERSYGLRLAGEVELVHLRVTARTPLPRPAVTQAPLRQEEPRRPRAARGYSFRKAAWTEFIIWDRAAIAPGATIDGPALIVEPTATTYVDSDYRM